MDAAGECVFDDPLRRGRECRRRPKNLLALGWRVRGEVCAYLSPCCVMFVMVPGVRSEATGELACPRAFLRWIRWCEGIAAEGTVVHATFDDVVFAEWRCETNVAVIGGITVGQRHRLTCSIDEKVAEDDAGMRLDFGARETTDVAVRRAASMRAIARRVRYP